MDVDGEYGPLSKAKLEGAGGSTGRKAEAAKSFDKSLAGTYTVNTKTDPLTLRSGAGTSKKRLTSMPKGAKVQCYGYYTKVGSVKWLYVVYDGVTGFASAEYLKKQ
ncbi:SH3 domain-containing protein [Lachnospiraceae bacterium KGMB03038]|nr:SH3 domain-containing protein [Lachnospiraceae bacterium KGMB03038]